ncbi:MAG: ABC transporter ATP-binding protein/permease [Bacteroidales bacterium]|nr:ABC transporter ATP-binding protein/permease [Bacteroidales bacterium]
MKDLKTCLKGLKGMAGLSVGLGVLNVLIGCLRIAASLYFVWICKRLVDIATGVCDAPFAGAAVAMGVTMLLQILVGLAYSYIAKLNAVKTQNSLRERYFEHVLNSRWNGREEFRSGDTINRLEEDIRVISELLCDVFPGAIVTVLQLLAASCYLLFLAPSLLWILLLMMVVAVLCSKLYFKKLRVLTSEIRAADSDVQHLITENVQNRMLVLTLFGVGNVVSRLSGINRYLKDKTVTRLNYNAVARGFMNFGFTGGYAVAFLWGVLGILHGTVTFGMMTSFLQLVGQVQRPIASLSSQIPSFIKAMTSVERLLELADLELETPEGDFVAGEAPGIVFNDVTFAYEKKNVLEHFTHTFSSGSLTVIAGPTGVGKSTMTKLMLGLLRPTQGSVTIESSDGRSHAADVDTRGNFMYVPQGNSLMTGTIRENMLLAKPDATEAEISEALKAAAAEFVFDLEKGLDSPCGEHGSGLSEGQCQRIAVARALLHDGGVMILDEATSALDSETEERLLDNLKTICKGRKTIVFISHRPAALKIADDSVILQ